MLNLRHKAQRLRSELVYQWHRREYARPTTEAVTPEQRAFWETQGYLVLPRHFTREQVGAINSLVDELWRTARDRRPPTVVDIYIGTPQERRTRLADAPLEARAQPYKMNDLFLESPLVRETILEPRLSAILENLLEGPPLICNTLNLEFGSQQSDHYDSLYMAAPREQYLVASWIGLEDSSADAGPLRYYPGSHRIPPYRFSNGGTAAVSAEMDQYREYMARELERRGISLQIFIPQAGDVFIWHSQLYHGGEKIRNPSLTRRSLVTHYWRARDLHMIHGRIGPGRYYLLRGQQPVDAPPEDH